MNFFKVLYKWSYEQSGANIKSIYKYMPFVRVTV